MDRGVQEIKGRGREQPSSWPNESDHVHRTNREAHPPDNEREIYRKHRETTRKRIDFNN